MNYREILKSKLNQLKSESRYRTFIELERQTGWHPHALWNSPNGPKDVVIWCSNDYLGMGQNSDVVKALTSAIDVHGTGAGGTRNISGTSAAIVALESELADLHGKERALVLTSGYVANEASISAIAGLFDNVLPQSSPAFAMRAVTRKFSAIMIWHILKNCLLPSQLTGQS